MLSSAEAVPTTVQAVLAFTAFIVPGFMLLRGYTRSRARNSSQADLHLLAEAIVGSLVLLAILWWWRGQTVFNLAEHRKLVQHETYVYEFLLVLLVAPYLVGLLAGWTISGASRLVERFRPPEGASTRLAAFFYFLDSGGLLTQPTVWDQAWNQIARHGAALVRVRTTSGNEIVGTIEPGAWVGLTPDPRDIYLRRVYRLNAEVRKWEPVPHTEGVVLSASSVESAEFIWAAEPRRKPERKTDRDQDRPAEGSGDKQLDDRRSFGNRAAARLESLASWIRARNS